MVGRAIAFLAVFLLLQLGWQALRGTAFERVIVHDATVLPAAFLVNKLTPDVRAQAVGFTLQAPGGGLNILNGCEGMEAPLLLVTAFMVTPLRWFWWSWVISMRGSFMPARALPRPLELGLRALVASVVVVSLLRIFEQALVEPLMPLFRAAIRLIAPEFTINSAEIAHQGPNNGAAVVDQRPVHRGRGNLEFAA